MNWRDLFRRQDTSTKSGRVLVLAQLAMVGAIMYAASGLPTAGVLAAALLLVYLATAAYPEYVAGMIEGFEDPPPDTTPDDDHRDDSGDNPTHNDLVDVYDLAPSVSTASAAQTSEARGKVEEGAETKKKIVRTSVEPTLRDEYYAGTKENPFGNFMLTDPVDRAAARPAFCPEVSSDISALVRKQTQMLNPGIADASKVLYGDEYDIFELNTGILRNFYTVPNTQKLDNQDAFAQWLYGDMLSARDQGPGAALARIQDNERYLLY